MQSALNHPHGGGRYEVRLWPVQNGLGAGGDVCRCQTVIGLVISHISPGLQVTNISHHLTLIPSHPGWPWQWQQGQHADRGNPGGQASSPSLLPSLCSQECFKFPLHLHAFPKSHIFLETGCPSLQLSFDPLCGSVPKRGCRSLDSTKGSSAFHKALRHPLQGFPLSSSQLSVS